jgi:Raf kinase inhibitor-like YbhB/YbcL family protein
MMPEFSLHSTDFVRNDVMPPRFTCSGANVSPALEWGSVPPETESFALICEDPDAPRGLWVHWVIYNIPKNVRGLPQRVETEAELPDGSRQGKNDAGKIGYSGPCPPPGHGPHRYFFRLYALDTRLDLAPGATRGELLGVIEGHVIGQAEVMGRFERADTRR